MTNIHIAIDGPAGAGKGTVAKELADRLNLINLDTGAMYRCVAYAAKNAGVESDDNDSLGRILNEIRIVFEDKGKTVILNGEDVTTKIRTDDINKRVGGISINPFVRKALVEKQQAYAEGKDIVMEGRDIGTVVLKDSPYKFYLDADPKERARRRFEQNKEKNIPGTYDEILADIIRRDELDMNRETDPLRLAEDAIYIDSSLITASEVCDIIISHIERIKRGEK